MSFVCDRCGARFDDAPERCTKCLRKSTLREVTDRPSSEAARLAAGDHSMTAGAQRMTALFVALGLAVALGIGVTLAWSWLDATEIRLPVVVGSVIAAAGFVWAALADAAPAWSVLARRCGLALGIGAWAAVSGVLALLTTADLSALFTLAIAAIVFGGGVIPVLRWLSAKEERPAPTGKWR